MILIKHPRFRDVAMEVLKVRRYKSGYVDLKFFWVYPELRGRSNVRIFSKVAKMRITESKYREFVNV